MEDTPSATQKQARQQSLLTWVPQGIKAEETKGAHH